MLSSITLQGFKSFADRTRLEFTDGVCAVIGPNGSGKSNVVEALRWATHGARARELRAGRGTELIFHGSGGKAPLGLAEVQIELQTADGRINLARRIYRDSSSEQDLNAKRVRVRDVHMALRGTGLGPGGLAVIGQGEVSGVVQAEGKTLLGYMQEAAGLSRAVTTRQETERKLSDVDQHLSQLKLLLEERETSVLRLEEAAKQARKHRQLTDRILTLKDAIKRDKQAQLRVEIAKAQAEVLANEVKSAELGHQSQAAAAKVEQAREAAQVAKTKRDAQAAALETLAAAREAKVQAERYLQHLQSEQANLQAEQEGLPQQSPTKPAPDLAQVAEAVTRARVQAEQAEAVVKRLDKELSRTRIYVAQQAEAAARADASQATLQSEHQQTGQELADLEPVLQIAEQQLQKIIEQRIQLEQTLKVHGEQNRQAKELRGELAHKMAQLEAAMGPLKRERERLEKLLNSYSRYGEGARNALQLNHPGIVGSVADLMTVPAEYEIAVGAAMGRRLEQVVVHTGEDARQIIAELKRVGGRATFLPLDLIRARGRRDAGLLREQGVLGNMADLCPTDPPLVAENLLSGTLLVEDLQVANRLARQYQSRPRLVTLEGELVESGGAITGGRLRDTGSAVLGDQRRFTELDEELLVSEEQLKQLKTRLAQYVEDSNSAVILQDLTAQCEQVSKQEREINQQVTERRAQIKSLKRQLEQLTQKMQAQQVSAWSTTEPLPDLDQLEADLTKQRQQSEELRAKERQALEAQALARELSAAWQTFQQAEERKQVLVGRLYENQQATEKQKAHLQMANDEVERRVSAVVDLDEDELTKAETAREEAAAIYSNLIAKQNKIRAKLDDLRLLIARREGNQEELLPGCLPTGLSREWTAELNRHRSVLDQMGPINARAEQDYAREKEQLDQQQAEVSDVEQAATELRIHLKTLEEAEYMATEAAYQRVNTAFQEYSKELLGGNGVLETEYDSMGRLMGLRLAVQPKGKRTRSMNLLSAGERTMAGLGFLFALNHAVPAAPKEAGETGESARGLPLAVLDEVDAPLDEANIRRFTAFLERFAARGTQFILVTHQKATMEVANALWGVTTDQTGASRVLSIKQADDVL